MNEVLTPILARVTRGTELLPEEIEAALAEILEGRVADVQAAGFIIALRTKGESVEELAALVRTMHRYADHVDVAPGAIDTCGTGGDRSGTVNVSTMADEGKYTKEYVPFLSMAKYYASEVAVKVSGEALQMLGAAGYMKDHLTELYYRDARQLTIVEGTSQVQLGLIARGVLDHDCWWD